MIVYILLILLLMISSIVLLYRMNRLRQEHGEIAQALEHFTSAEENAVTTEQMTETLKQLFARLNIEYREQRGEDNQPHFFFDYQAGHFIFEVVETPQVALRLYFPGIATVELDEVDVLRMACNELNLNSSLVFAVYTIDSSENSAELHLSAGLCATTSLPYLEKSFKRMAATCFNFNRTLERRLHELLNQSREYAFEDIEYLINRNRVNEEVLLNCELEYTHRHFGEKATWTKGEAVTVDDFLNRTSVFTHSALLTLECTAGEKRTLLTASDDIRRFVLHQALTGENPRENGFVHNEAIIKITALRNIRSNEGTDLVEHVLLIYLQAVRQTDTALFYRLTFCLPQRESRAVKAMPAAEAWANPVSGAFLLAYDLTDEQKRRAEFEYMWAEAKDKTANGKNHSQLSAAEMMLGNFLEENVALNAYWGNRLFRERRYFEASILLERAWNMLNERFHRLTKAEKSSFYYLSFQIGMSLFHLHLYTQACYYLQLTEGENNVEYLKGFIHCLIAARDPRARTMVRSTLSYTEKRVEELKEKEENIPVALSNFRNFLRRRDVFLDLEEGNRDEAERKCKLMLQENENVDFALSELAHIQRLREAENAQQTDTSPNADRANDTDNRSKTS